MYRVWVKRQHIQSKMNVSELSFELKSPQFLKFLKQFKLNETLYFKIHKNIISVRNIDLKQYLGVIDKDYVLQNEVSDTLYFSLNGAEMCKMLENFEDLVIVTYERVNSAIRIKNLTNTQYVLRCDTSLKVKSYHDLKFIPEFEQPILSFKINDLDCLNGFKIVSTVENLITLVYENIGEKKINLKSKRITSISTSQWSKELKEIAYNGNESWYSFEIYYSPNLFSGFLKEGKDITIKVYEKYFHLSSEDYNIYIPLR